MKSQSVPSKLQSPWKRLIGWGSRYLSIRKKISCGYALALGVAVLGTSTGFAIGDYSQQQAREQEKDALEEIRDLNRLQTNLLLARSHQQHLVGSVEKPEQFREDYAHFLKHLTDFTEIWSKLKEPSTNPENPTFKESSAEIEALHHLLQHYEIFLEEYFRQAKLLLSSMNSQDLKLEDIDVNKKLILSLNNPIWDSNLEHFIDDLDKTIDIVNNKYEEARENGIAADRIRERIIAASILLSMTFALILAISTSRAIARPLQITTKVAQQVIQEENFDLQAPVLTEDEVGALTTTLNHLIQRVKQLLEDQKAANQAQLMQYEKMSSLGRMMAGVAHEINNPINFIYGNSLHASEYVEDLLALLEIYSTAIPHPPQPVRACAEEIDVDFLKEDLPKLLESMKVGAERAKQIIYSLKDFSRLDEEKADSVDLHGCLDSTLLILNSRIKNQISVVRNYGNIPSLKGYAGLLYQVFMNLLSNAIDALEESKSDKQITITTELQDNEWVVVKIADNGSGIARENQAKIFDVFFTTKPRGVGTGLGLTISYQIIVEKHGGKLACQSEVGVGTEFAIALPVEHNPLTEPSHKNSLLATSV